MCFADVTARPATGGDRRAGYRVIVSQQRAAGSPLRRTAGAPAKGAAYPGKELGLPESGPMSVAPMWRRLAALFADWLLCMLIAAGLLHSQYWTIAIFAFEVYVLTAMAGITVGKRLLGIRVIRTNGGRVGFRWAAVRTLLLLTVVPPLLTDRDLRGLHDRASDTVVVRL
jgi:RDD family